MWQSTVKDTMEQPFFAFISYSRKDIRIARTIQQNLEKYPYPKDKVIEENRPYDSKYIRRVFLDITDLSAQERQFTDELKKRIEGAKYLIVICSRNSVKSGFVKREIEHFCKTHGNRPDLILPVLVDETITPFHPVIDEIVARRNCPIYFSTDEKTEHKLDNKYCFYHIVEFLLKVDFNTLFNRYMAYTKRRARKRITWLSVFFLLILTALSHGFYKAYRLSQFEKKTFPYSLVVGYVNNFMSPLIDCMDTETEKPNFIFLMPGKYDDLNNWKRDADYTGFIKRNYEVDSIRKEIYKSEKRKRDYDISRLHIHNCKVPIYLDIATTASAFKYVIDYKINSDLYTDQSRDEMTIEYTKEFIKCTKDSLAHKGPLLHFVKDTLELKMVLDELITKP